MAAELNPLEQNPNTRKRKMNHGKGKRKKPNKKLKPVARAKNPTQKMKKLFKQRVEAYNSDEEQEEPMSEEDEEEEERRDLEVEREIRRSDDDEDDEDEGEEEQKDGAHMGFSKFNEGCRAFKVAFLTIMKKRLPNDPLGPILSAHKKLVAEKLAEEETEHKAKGEAKKEKHLAGEKGHVKPANFLDSKEKSLISIATKGVVKLFNAVNKAQNPQRGLNPSRSKDAKELAKRRKQTFLSELKKSTMEAPGGPSPFNSSKANRSVHEGNNDAPSWAPLREDFMRANPKLNWDQMPDPLAVADQGNVPLDSSSDED
ncbi:RRP15-like protein isoform X1 [Iris pallida]|uniref:RRP15-like protein isoform X1 n=1 Tax=Iris pallida TaxID=29817 RepID=A0AAX6GS40_IRIPA|nr:RRP15-like protein isoform X1 [Iris pallida]